MKIQLTMDNNR